MKANMKDLKGDLIKIERHIRKWIQITQFVGFQRHFKKVWFITHDMGELEDLCYKLDRHDKRIRRIQQDLQHETNDKVLALLTRSSMKQDAKEGKERKETRKKLNKFVKEKGPDKIVEAARNPDPQTWIQLKKELVERGTSPVVANVMMGPMKERLSKLEGAVVEPSQLKLKMAQPKPGEGQSKPKEGHSKPEDGQPKPEKGHLKPEQHPNPEDGHLKPEKRLNPKEGPPKSKERRSKSREGRPKPEEHMKQKEVQQSSKDGHKTPNEHSKSEEHPNPKQHPKLKEKPKLEKVQRKSKEGRASILSVHGNERGRHMPLPQHVQNVG